MHTATDIDAQTGDTESRPLTAEETAQREKDIAAAQAIAKAEAERRAAAESARRKIAEASGLTPQEMAALGF